MLLAAEQKALVLHVGLGLPDGQMIMASDTIAGLRPPRAGQRDRFGVYSHERR